jgi:hypothetical protein
VAGNKTQPTDASVADFIASVTDGGRREECRSLLRMMGEITGCKARMWGSMIGFGQYHYRYASGREGDFFITGFAPRKSALTIYIMPGLAAYEAQLEALGPHRTGKSCLYLKRLDTVDLAVLREIIRDSVETMRSRYTCSP